MTAAPAFELEEVRFGGVDNALGPVTLHIPGRGITVLAGPSGAGKTSLLRTLNRLAEPLDGSIVHAGRELSEWEPTELRRRVGMVFQRPPLFEGTVGDNLRVARPQAGDAELVHALERVGLGADLLDREATVLSGGEAQRMCFARAILTGPAVLLADEPTASLDGAATRQVEELALGLCAGGMPIVWVTHDVEQVRRLADHVVVLVAGRVRATGSVDEVARSDDPEIRAAVGR